MNLVLTTVAILGTTLVVVPALKRLGMASVIGYLLVGVILGPYLLKVITDPEEILAFSEYGIVLLLFLIGIELEPARLWILRRSVFGLGGLQVLVTGSLFVGIAWLLNYSWQMSLILGFSLAMSSTAFVLQMLVEKNQLTTQYGRKAFSILLFQDLAVIPLIACVPWLSGKVNSYDLKDGIILALVFVLFFVSSRTIIRPALRFVASSGSPEVFTAAALFLVIGAASLMQILNVPMSLGAFAAGVLLADSEFRHEIEASLQPIKSLLLGLFFIAIGMSIDLRLLWNHPFNILGLVVVLILSKWVILTAVAYFSTRSNFFTAIKLGAILAQGGEFAFVIFAEVSKSHLLSEKVLDKLTLVVSLSMLLTPVILLFLEKIEKNIKVTHDQREFDEVPDKNHEVVIAGFGRFGQIVARILSTQHIKFTALESNVRQVDFLRGFGSTVYYGNPSKIELLRAAGVAKAKIFVLAIDDVQDSVKTAQVVRKYFPHIKIYARARHRAHAYQLMDLGVELVNREMYLSSVDLSKKVLLGLGYSDERAAETIARFVSYDQQLMIKQHAIYQDESKLMETMKESMKELESLFESDRRVLDQDDKGRSDSL